MTEDQDIPTCEYCGIRHASTLDSKSVASGVLCSRIKEVEYYRDGSIKRVVLRGGGE